MGRGRRQRSLRDVSGSGLRGVSGSAVGTAGRVEPFSEQRAAVAAKEATYMSKNAKIAAGGVAAGILLLIWLPWWAALLIVIGVPTAAYLTLDPSQRRRLRRISRKEIGR
ncbi:hypothetical protein a10_07418 [Streptomyces acidiscabies]|nr:hypothetical protein a10_07418 [Streptomyces acidiscabies]GAV40655.1 hypothetical protein Saa2_03550 [Streptomyces acidiscabies]